MAQQQTVTYSITPSTFEETTSITITINGTSINEATWGVTGNTLYLWAWAFNLDDVTQKGTPLNGAWEASNEDSKFTYNAGNDTYTKTFTPATYYNTTPPNGRLYLSHGSHEFSHGIACRNDYKNFL